MVTKRVLVSGFVLACALAAAPAAEAQQAPGDTLRVHVVREGDTLWDIARRYLRDPFRWTEVFQLNRGVVENPDLIFPAERLRIPLLAAGTRPLPGTAAGAPIARDAVAQGEDRTVFYPTLEASAAEHRLRLAEAARPDVVTRGDFLRAGVLMEETALTPVGRLVEIVSPTVVPIGMEPQIQVYDRVFMTVEGAGVAVGDRVQLVRQGRRIQPYGRLHETTGVARVAALDRGVATVVVEEMYDVVAVGDAAVPMPEFRLPAGAAPEAAGGLEGQIVAFHGEHALQSVEDVAYLNLGRASGVVEGDEFVVVLPEERRSWGIRPEIEVARLRVVRSSDVTAAARVIALEQPALERGLQVRLVAKMP